MHQVGNEYIVKVSFVNCVYLNFKSSTFEFHFRYFIFKFQIYAHIKRGKLIILNSYNTPYVYLICVNYLLSFCIIYLQ